MSARKVEMDVDLPDVDPDKWKMTSLQVLERALERVAAGTHATAQEAIGRDTARECHDGSPVTPAWGLLLESLGPTRLSKEEHEKAYLKYHAISDFGEKPDQAGEREALENAIAYTKAKEKVREVLARGKAVTAGHLVTETGLTWDQVDAVLLSFGSEVVHIPMSPECFVFRKFLQEK